MFIIFRTQQWNLLNLHFHKGMEILLTLSDGGKMYINNTVYPIRRGSLFVMNSMDFHRSEGASVAQPYQFCAVDFAADEVSGMSGANFDLTACFTDHRNFNHRYQLDEEQLEKLMKQLHRLEYYLAPECAVYGKEVYGKTCLAEILIYINGLYKSAENETSLPRSKKPLDRVFSVVQYIQEHYAEDLSLENLAGTFFISKSQL